jgi:periplasmic divalent cation tolerance protein
MTAFIEVHTTTETQEDAQRIAHAVVEARLAACAQVLGPIESTYWWEGKVERAEEWLLVIKSARERYDAVEEMVRSNHPYEVPEILAVPVVAGSERYLSWILGELGGSA